MSSPPAENQIVQIIRLVQDIAAVQILKQLLLVLIHLVFKACDNQTMKLKSQFQTHNAAGREFKMKIDD